MSKERNFKNCILFLLILTIMFGSFICDIHKTSEFIDRFEIGKNYNVPGSDSPITRNILTKADNSYILYASEVRDARSTYETVKNPSSYSAYKIFSFSICILLILSTIESLKRTVIPSVFPWSDIILSRFRIIQFLHNKDGLK